MRRLTKLGTRISNSIGKAIADYNLIEDKDKILVAVSGGKDSLSMLKLLAERRRWAPVDYGLVAIHIETDYRCAGCAHRSVLKKIFEDMGVEYRFEKIKILDKKRGVSCFWCSWNRRKALFLAAKDLDCNKIAMGHHRDDIIETLLLNLFYHGEFSAMNPSQELFEGELTIIRPLCYVEEDLLRRFAAESGFPRQLCRCPNSLTSKRRMMKDIIRLVKRDCAYVKMNVFKSMARINTEYTAIKGEGDIDAVYKPEAHREVDEETEGPDREPVLGDARKGRE
jgi:tRNA 2-thiocytidine biosynthesis protein TtcA